MGCNSSIEAMSEFIPIDQNEISNMIGKKGKYKKKLSDMQTEDTGQINVLHKNSNLMLYTDSNKPRTLSLISVPSIRLIEEEEKLDYIPEQWLKSKEKDYLYEHKIYFKKFTKSFQNIYTDLQDSDIKVIITCDSILYAFNKIREKCIEDLETNVLYGKLNNLCVKIFTYIKNLLDDKTKKFSEQARNIMFLLKFYFSIPYSILNINILGHLTGSVDMNMESTKSILEMMGIFENQTLFMNTIKNILAYKDVTIKICDVTLRFSGNMFEMKKYDLSSIEFKKYFLALTFLCGFSFDIVTNNITTNNKSTLVASFVSKILEPFLDEIINLELSLDEVFGLTCTNKLKNCLTTLNSEIPKTPLPEMLNWMVTNLSFLNKIFIKNKITSFQMLGKVISPNLVFDTFRNQGINTFSSLDLAYTLFQNDTAKNKMSENYFKQSEENLNLIRIKNLTLSNKSFHDQYMKLIRSLTFDSSSLRNGKKKPFCGDLWNVKQLKTQLGSYVDFAYTNQIQNSYVLQKYSNDRSNFQDKEIMIEPISLFWNDMLCIVLSLKDIMLKEFVSKSNCIKKLDMLEKILRVIIRNELDKFKYILSSYLTLFDETDQNVYSKYFSIQHDGEGKDICLGLDCIDVMFVELDNGKIYAGPTYSVHEFEIKNNTKSTEISGYVDFNLSKIYI
jgi:hypothetical protein